MTITASARIDTRFKRRVYTFGRGSQLELRHVTEDQQQLPRHDQGKTTSEIVEQTAELETNLLNADVV